MSANGGQHWHRRDGERRMRRTSLGETALKVDDERETDDVELLILGGEGKVEEVALDDVRGARVEVDGSGLDPWPVGVWGGAGVSASALRKGGEGRATNSWFPESRRRREDEAVGGQGSVKC